MGSGSECRLTPCMSTVGLWVSSWPTPSTGSIRAIICITGTHCKGCRDLSSPGADPLCPSSLPYGELEASRSPLGVSSKGQTAQVLWTDPQGPTHEFG